MAYWLLKTEPDAYSWDDQVKKGAKGDAWTGVRNFAARKNLQAMKKGDRAFFYHTGDEKQVVGIVEIIKEAYKDPTDEKGVFDAVDTKAVAPVPKPVTLAAIKAEPKLKSMVLVREARLSVQAVSDEEWKLVCKMGGVKGYPGEPIRSSPMLATTCARIARGARASGGASATRRTSPACRSRRPPPRSGARSSCGRSPACSQALPTPR